MGRPTFTIRNSSGVGLYCATVVIKDYCARICPDYAWESAGWKRLENGSVAYVDNPSSNRWVYYYAERDDGGVYRGSYATDALAGNFRKCECLGVNPNLYFRLGSKPLDTNQYTGVNLK